MANTVNVGLTTTTNTFNQWRITNNLLVDDVNEIARGDFTKPNGRVNIATGRVIIANGSGGVFLEVKSSADIDETLYVKNIETDNTLITFTSPLRILTGVVWIRKPIIGLIPIRRFGQQTSLSQMQHQAH